jgi:molecular chaperone DnaK
LVYSTEKFLSENSDKIPGDVKTQVESDMAAVKTALEGDDTDAIAAATAKLGTSSQSMGAAMYANANADSEASSGAQAGAAGSDEDEGIVDAEIVDDGPETDAQGRESA